MKQNVPDLLSQFPGEIILRSSQIKLFLCTLGMSIGAALGVWALFSGKLWLALIGIFLCVVIFPLIFFVLFIAISGRGWLAIRKDGIQQCLFKVYEPTNWNEIRNIRVGLLGYAIRVRYDKWVAASFGSNSGKWVTTWILDSYGMRIEDLLALLNGYQQLALKKKFDG